MIEQEATSEVDVEAKIVLEKKLAALHESAALQGAQHGGSGHRVDLGMSGQQHLRDILML